MSFILRCFNKLLQNYEKPSRSGTVPRIRFRKPYDVHFKKRAASLLRNGKLTMAVCRYKMGPTALQKSANFS